MPRGVQHAGPYSRTCLASNSFDVGYSQRFSEGSLPQRVSWLVRERNSEFETLARQGLQWLARLNSHDLNRANEGPELRNDEITFA
jgi:hypothetical protein